MSPATPDDITDRWRPLSDQEQTNAEAFLEDAWEELLSRRPAMEANLTAGTVRERNVVRVLCAAVLRVLKNPDGYEQESVDDWSGRRGDLTASGLLYFTDDELGSVTPTPAGGSRSSVRLVIYGDA